MTTRSFALVAVAAIGVAACGGKGSTPTSPTPTETRIIRLEANLDFGDVPVGGTSERILRIYNHGTAPMTVTSLNGPAPGVYTASWTSGTIAAGASEGVTVRFAPTAAQTYAGTLTVNANHTSGTNTIPITGRGLRDLFRRSGSGDNVFDMPSDVARVRIIGTYGGYTSNFIVRIGGRTVVNELLGAAWGTTRYEGVVLTGGGGVVEIRNSSGVAWSFEEVR